jgi:hypothetical protein
MKLKKECNQSEDQKSEKGFISLIRFSGEHKYRFLQYRFLHKEGSVTGTSPEANLMT